MGLDSAEFEVTGFLGSEVSGIESLQFWGNGIFG